MNRTNATFFISILRKRSGHDALFRRAEKLLKPSRLDSSACTSLLDGALDVDTVVRTLDAESLLSEDERQHYHTLGGLAMQALGRVPRTGDVFERSGYRFEIVDMDGNRVDRLLVGRMPTPNTDDRR